MIFTKILPHDQNKMFIA